MTLQCVAVHAALNRHHSQMTTNLSTEPQWNLGTNRRQQTQRWRHTLWRSPPSRLALLRFLALAALVEVLATVVDFLGRPRQLQAVHAVVVPGVAVVHVSVRGRRLARRRQPRWGRQPHVLCV